MKKLVLLIVAIATINVAQAQGQFEVKINPLGLLFDSPEISGEYLVGDYFGVELALSVDYGKANFANTYDDANPTKSGFGGKIVGKYYFSPDDGGDGWYGGIFIRTKALTVDDKDKPDYLGYTRDVTSIGFEAGQKWVFDTGILIGWGIGIGRPISEKNEWLHDNSSTDYGSFLDVDVYSQFVIGYRFN